MSVAARIVSIILLMLPMSGAPSLAANIYPYGNGSKPYIAVDGEIAKGDLARLRTTYERARRGSGLIVSLDSPGGDLSEAMAMGRWIRQTKAWTAISQHASCASACVYVFAAGVQKMPLGKLLIHRPYLMDRPAGGVSAALKNALSASRSYFAEMNVPEGLADIMFSIAPHDIRLLKPSEIEHYRLEGEDMAEAEGRVLDLIKKLGISRMEYMRRSQIYQQSPELARCLTMKGDAIIDCGRKVCAKYGVCAED
jgi:hypothetical protein